MAEDECSHAIWVLRCGGCAEWHTIKIVSAYYGVPDGDERHTIVAVSAYCGAPDDDERHMNEIVSAYLIILAFTPMVKAKDKMGKAKDEKGKNFVYNYF